MKTQQQQQQQPQQQQQNWQSGKSCQKVQDIPESENKDCNGNFDISASVENVFVANTSSTDAWEHYSVMESNSDGEHLCQRLSFNKVAGGKKRFLH